MYYIILVKLYALCMYLYGRFQPEIKFYYYYYHQSWYVTK